MIRPLAFLTLLAASPAQADSHAVTVQNGTAETIRSIVISPSPGTGESRLRSTLPPGATARLTYSTGCQANVRIGYDSGRTEDHGVDMCSDPRIVAGTDGVAGPATAFSPGAATVKPAASTPSASTTTSARPALAPPPIVPPWTGKSITKRFGGMD